MREEVASVRWDDMAEEGWLKVMGKGDQPAKLPLNPMLAEVVATVERTHPVWVFPGRRRGSHVPHVSPNTVWMWVGEVATDAGLGGVTTHRLRHTCPASPV